MKNIIKLLLLAFIIGLGACKKVADLAHYPNGTTPVLTASAATVAATPADSSSTVLTLSWTNPNYATAQTNEKFTIQIDSAGRNFTKATSITVLDSLHESFTAKQLNDIILGWGLRFGIAYSLDIRLISSYANNNEQYTSNTIHLNFTAYRVPPKVTPPPSGHLYLVGDATVGGWNNPVPTPTQEFAMMDSTTYVGVFYLNGGNQYLALPVNGDWSNKYAVADNSVPGISAGGVFGYNGGNNTYNSNFPAPATSGYYKIVFDFQQGTFAVTPYGGNLPTALYIVGSATPGSWSNPVPTPSQQFTQLNSTQFSITLPLTGGGEYLLLPVNGDWSNKYAVADNTVAGLSAGGLFGYNGGNSTFNANFPAPATSGTYTILADFGNTTVVNGATEYTFSVH